MTANRGFSSAGGRQRTQYPPSLVEFAVPREGQACFRITVPASYVFKTTNPPFITRIVAATPFKFHFYTVAVPAELVPRPSCRQRRPQCQSAGLWVARGRMEQRRPRRSGARARLNQSRARPPPAAAARLALGRGRRTFALLLPARGRRRQRHRGHEL